MIRSIAFSALLAAGFAMSGLPALAQGTSSGSACSSDDPFCNSRPGGVPGMSGRDLPEDPGYYRPDPRPRPPHRPPNFPGPPPGYYRPPPPPDFYYSDRISCRQAKNIVRNEGFHQVRALDCEGRQYQFRASYKGRPVIVVISSRSGRILDVEWL
jgi:hypothetical protein